MHKLFNLKSGEYDLRLELRGKTTILCGNSAAGKSYLYCLIQEADNTKDIILFNYNYLKSEGNYDIALKAIEDSEEKLIIIDQVDDVQRKDARIMNAINIDKGNNRFILIGRNPKVIYAPSDVANLNIHNNIISLKYPLDEPLI